MGDQERSGPKFLLQQKVFPRMATEFGIAGAIKVIFRSAKNCLGQRTVIKIGAKKDLKLDLL